MVLPFGIIQENHVVGKLRYLPGYVMRFYEPHADWDEQFGISGVVTKNREHYAEPARKENPPPQAGRDIDCTDHVQAV